MMNILEDVWYGNICPYDNLIDGDEEYSRELKVMMKFEDLVFGEVSGAIKEDIEKMVEAQQKLSCITDKNAFVIGVRFGVKMMIDTICS